MDEKGPDMSRRKFVVGGAGAIGAIAAGGPAMAQALDPRVRTPEFQAFRTAMENITGLTEELQKLSIHDSLTTAPTDLKDRIREYEAKRIATASYLETGIKDLTKKMAPWIEKVQGRIPGAILHDFREYAIQLQGTASILLTDEHNFHTYMFNEYMSRRLPLSDKTETLLEQRTALLAKKVRTYANMDLMRTIKTI